MLRRYTSYVSHAYRGSQRRRTAPGRGEGGFETRPYVPGATPSKPPSLIFDI
ncbi:MAG: hypothetical protein LBM98_11345 [Oscillospiraceae bacterium]|nr:hypothetical protein [Oscillospiraceae bacterium]